MSDTTKTKTKVIAFFENNPDPDGGGAAAATPANRQVDVYIVRAQEGDQDALAEVIHRCRGLICTIANRMRHRKLYMYTIEDIEQEATVALIELVHQFDVDGTASFAHYAWDRIRWHLVTALYSDAPVHGDREVERRMRNALRDLKAEDETPTLDALAEHTGLIKFTVRRLYAASLPPSSLDQGAETSREVELDDPEGDTSLYDCIDTEEQRGFKDGVRRPTEDEALERIYNEQARQAIENALEADYSLSEREQDVMRARYRGHNQGSAAKVLGITPGQASGAYRNARRKLRGLLADFAPPPSRFWYRGVRSYRTKDGYLRWEVYLNKGIRYGTYDTSREAALGYDRGALERLGAGAKLNFPELVEVA